MSSTSSERLEELMDVSTSHTEAFLYRKLAKKYLEKFERIRTMDTIYFRDNTKNKIYRNNWGTSEHYFREIKVELMKFWNLHGQRCWELYDCKEYRELMNTIRSARNVVKYMKDLFEKPRI